MSLAAHFKPRPGRFGVQVIALNSGQIGGANFLGGATPLTANTTTTFRLGPVPRRCAFARLCASTVTVPVDNDGTILARAVKYSAATTAQVIMSNDIDLQALVTRQGNKANLLTGIADGDRIVQEGDSIEINVVNNSAAIDTQPAGLVFTVELYELE